MPGGGTNDSDVEEDESALALVADGTTDVVPAVGRDAQAQPDLPYLPPEVWIKILEQLAYVNPVDFFKARELSKSFDSMVKQARPIFAFDKYFKESRKSVPDMYRALQMLNLKLVKGLETIPGGPLIEAMRSDNLGLAKALIEATPRQRGTANGRQPNALQIAVYQPIQRAIRDPNGYSDLLIMAVDVLAPRLRRRDYDGDVIAYLIDKGADVNYQDNSGMAALHYARSSKIVHLLIAKGAIVDLRDNQGLTPLHFHCTERLRPREGVIEALLGHRANPTTIDNAGDSVLRNAIDERKFRAASILLDHGADPTQGFANLAFMNLLGGPEYFDDDFPFVQKMFARGAPFPQVTLTGLLILMVKQGYINTANVLIDQGADVNVIRRIVKGRNPIFENLLHTAALGDNPDAVQPMIDYLISSKGLDINAIMPNGMTQLSNLVTQYHASMYSTSTSPSRRTRLRNAIQHLVNNGADPNLAGPSGTSAIDAAESDDSIKSILTAAYASRTVV